MDAADADACLKALGSRVKRSRAKLLAADSVCWTTLGGDGHSRCVQGVAALLKRSVNLNLNLYSLYCRSSCSGD
jgi:hypothetical protein